MKRPTDAELIDILERAANFYEHISNRRVFRAGSAAEAQVVIDAHECRDAVKALRATRAS